MGRTLYIDEQKKELIAKVEEYKKQGMMLKDAVKKAGVPIATYSGWKAYGIHRNDPGKVKRKVFKASPQLHTITFKPPTEDFIANDKLMALWGRTVIKYMSGENNVQ